MVENNYYSSINYSIYNLKNYFEETTISDNAFGISSSSMKQLCKECYKKRCRKKKRAI